MATNSSANIPTGVSGTILQGQGVGSALALSTATYPSTAGTSGKILVSNGTNIVSSTPTFPNASATSGKFIRSDGTNWIASTPTLPTTAGTSGNILTSDGTNFLSSAFPTRVTTINGDSGSITGATVSIISNLAANAAGATVKFTNSSTTSTLSLVNASDTITIGRVAGNATMTGTQNVGIGTACFNSLTSGGNNAALGFISQQFCSTGIQNVSVGYSALHTNSTGNSNTAIGYQALSGLTAADSNTSVGSGTLQALLTGTSNIAIGVLGGSNYTSSESSNILIGHAGIVGESNVMRIGTNGVGINQISSTYIAGITGVTVTGTAVLCSTAGQLGTIASSERYKENISSISEDISILHLRPVEFNYKNDEFKNKQYGLIAEDIDKFFPYLCFYNESGDPESVKYHELPTLLLIEIQRLVKRIEKLESSV